MSRRIGLLGGTFNPVHCGHIDMAMRVQAAFALDQVLFVLSARPPHKGLQRLPDAELRLRMLQAALAPHAPRLAPCDIEMRRPEPSWTVDTLRQLRAERPGDVLFFICGSEGFLKIRTWKEHDQVLAGAYFIIVLRRPGHRRAVLSLLAAEGVAALDAEDPGRPLPAAFLFAYDSPLLDLSSTAVRRRARDGGDLSRLVAPEVRSMVEGKKLYECQRLPASSR